MATSTASWIIHDFVAASQVASFFSFFLQFLCLLLSCDVDLVLFTAIPYLESPMTMYMTYIYIAELSGCKYVASCRIASVHPPRHQHMGCYLCQNDYDDVHVCAFICTCMHYNMHVNMHNYTLTIYTDNTPYQHGITVLFKQVEYHSKLNVEYSHH